ncbi:hypothetical protein Tco_0134967, partial [Tanacetum coccineum]
MHDTSSSSRTYITHVVDANIRPVNDQVPSAEIDVKALDDGSVITKSSESKSDMHDTSSSSRTYITHVVDANIRPVNDQVPSAE